MCACTVLVLSNIGMLPSYTSATAATPAYLHTVASHLGSGHLGYVGHVRNTLSVVFEYVSTSGTSGRLHRNVSDRCRQFIDRGRLTVAEVPHARLSTRTPGLVGPSTLGERRRLTLAGPLGGGELPAQLLVGLGQTRVPILQPVYLSDQVGVLTGWGISVRAHSRSIRICLSDRNASAEAAYQLQCVVDVQRELAGLWRVELDACQQVPCLLHNHHPSGLLLPSTDNWLFTTEDTCRHTQETCQKHQKLAGATGWGRLPLVRRAHHLDPANTATVWTPTG